MHITVLNGSPKGDYSITLQTVLYLQKVYPSHTFEVVEVGRRIKALEKDLTPALEAMARAELLLFSYPVYTFLAPYPLHRFFELVKASGIDLSGKWATQITTSKHFYDITAHTYVQENCGDLGMRVIRGLSADMEDLLTEKGQNDARAFWDYVQFCIKQELCETPFAVPRTLEHIQVEIPVADNADKTGDVLVLTDCEPEDVQLRAMIDRFCAVMPRKTRVINLREYPFAGGCLGCFRCAVTGKCVHKDGFDVFLRETIQTAQAIVTAFTIKDHSMGAVFKCYDDRQFCNGHRAVTMGMPMGYLISGSYHAEQNLQTVVEARAQVGGNFLAGVATDERDPNGEIDALATSLAYALENGYTPPANFYGVGGTKIFRDLIWQMQGMMKADHRFFKKHGLYDFPQKKRLKMWAMYAVGALLSSPKILAKMGNKMNEGMLAPYKNVLGKMK
ncbi:MAG: iron-sulfur protein [Ruminococcaceae bacterium]|nr:iron-sulfur protein [Oscillospiraceae bacterium]